MRAFLKKLSSIIASIAVISFNAAITIATAIGLSTTADDAEGLKKKLPMWVNWLMGTPWWVPALLTLAMMAYVLWAFWPDKKLAEEMRDLRIQTREALQQAWDFKAQYLADVDRSEARDTALSEQLAQLLAAFEDMKVKNSELQASVKATVKEAAERADHVVCERILAMRPDRDKAYSDIREEMHMNFTNVMIEIEQIRKRLEP